MKDMVIITLDTGRVIQANNIGQSDMSEQLGMFLVQTEEEMILINPDHILTMEFSLKETNLH